MEDQTRTAAAATRAAPPGGDRLITWWIPGIMVECSGQQPLSVYCLCIQDSDNTHTVECLGDRVNQHDKTT